MLNQFKFFVVLFMLFLNCVCYSKQTPIKVNIEDFCSTYSGQNDFLKDLSQQVLSDYSLRKKLVILMQKNKAQGCQDALTDYLNKFMEDDSGQEVHAGFESYLLLAFASHLPVATKIIEYQINKGKLIDWLDVYKQSDKEAYLNTLAKYVNKVAVLVRKLDNAELVDGKDYGKIQQDETELKTPEAIYIWNPIMLHKYMLEIISQKIKLKKIDFADLNIIYAAFNQSYREIFLKEMASMVRMADASWVASFREEPTWVQFRLFPIMEKVGGGVVKRELIWLSTNHPNFKIRSLAQTTLDKIAKRG